MPRRLSFTELHKHLGPQQEKFWEKIRQKQTAHWRTPTPPTDPAVLPAWQKVDHIGTFFRNHGHGPRGHNPKMPYV